YGYNKPLKCEALNLQRNLDKVSPQCTKKHRTYALFISEPGGVMKNINALAGTPAQPSMLANIPRLVTAYYANRPDPSVPEHRVAFGTSGHRGSSLKHSFNEAHILATTQAICRYRQSKHIDGPLFLGIDTHALSEPALASTLEVLAANGVVVMI